MHLFNFLVVSLAAYAGPVLAAFGYSDNGSGYYRNNELQCSKTGSHIGSGLGSAAVKVTQNGNYIIVQCTALPVTHYMAVRKGDAGIYMGTHIQDTLFGELRFIARLNAKLLQSEYPYGDVSSYSGTTSVIEGADVVLNAETGQTRSKFYSADRYIDRGIHCVYGTAVDKIHVCMLIPQPESSSGGPLFRDIETSNSNEYNALYNYMWSSHTQT
ncbi:hypothetical protein S40293_07215 [Stachybotrys chartarum IBT 40293]|nr:hypothetical protein S40293_07215 [Stachybotrys chartarum IBT 40293]